MKKILGRLKIMGRKEGFTLAEVLLSVLIATITLTSSLLVLTKSNIFMTEIRQRNIASQAAKEEIESIRDMDYDNVLLLGSSFTTTSFNDLLNPVGTLTIDNCFSSNDIRRVTVAVTWNSSQGRTLSTSLSTLVTREGINRQ